MIGSGAAGSPAGVPLSYSDMTASGDQFTIVKGNLNKLRLRPQILNEHTESSRNLISTIASGNIVGQVFKASQDNINGLNLTLLSAASLTVDNFESYADDAALQAAWVASNVTYLATLATVEVGEGTQSMELSATAVVGDEWELVLPVADLTGYTGSLMIFQDNAYSAQKLRFYVGDGTNTASAPIVTTATSIWQTIEIAASQLVDDQAGITDLTQIIAVGFRVEQRRNNGAFLIDDLKAAAPGGSFELKLFDMGAISPVSGTNSLDDGTQYTKLGDAGISGVQVASIDVPLVGGFRQYHIDGFIAGVAGEVPTNELLTAGNYYAVTLNYVDTDIEVYGPNSAWDNYYENGYAFTAPDEATAITATGADEDIQFCIFSTQAVYIVSIFSNFGAAPGDESRMLVNIEDTNMRISAVVVQGVRGQQVVAQSFELAPYFMDWGGKFEINYNDDPGDGVSEVEYSIQYLFEPPVVNG